MALVAVTDGSGVVQTAYLYPDSDVDYQISNSEMRIINLLSEDPPEPIPPAQAWTGLDSLIHMFQFTANALPSTLGVRVGLESMPIGFNEAVHIHFEMDVYGSPSTFYTLEMGIVDSNGNELFPFTTPIITGVNPSIYRFFAEYTPTAFTDLASWNDAILVLNFTIEQLTESFFTVQFARVMIYYV